MATALSVPKRQRLTVPLVREQGRLRPASWEEALARAASLFQQIKDQRGPNALGVFSCSKSTNELNYLAAKFTRVVFGSHNVDSCNRT
jgi:formate dehydrogenase major subunit